VAQEYARGVGNGHLSHSTCSRARGDRREPETTSLSGPWSSSSRTVAPLLLLLLLYAFPIPISHCLLILFAAVVRVQNIINKLNMATGPIGLIDRSVRPFVYRNGSFRLCEPYTHLAQEGLESRNAYEE
jgi:hypothetical protein